ncbi:hypothetical protein [Citrobacter freundii]|uniref:hypothetical protein n=1 Tax=Citrobacter freundii TaxID=546 RepID=UPI003F9200F0
MTHFSQRDNFSTAARVLGALFYYAPDSAEASALVSALSNDGWQAQWPLEKTTLSPLVAQFQAEADESLPQAWHLFPWSSRFLNVFIEKADHPFYQALGELARLTLAQWQSQLLIPVADKPLFR